MWKNHSWKCWSDFLATLWFWFELWNLSALFGGCLRQNSTSQQYFNNIYSLFSATHNKKLNMHSATSLYIPAVNTTANYLRIEIWISTQETLVFLSNNKKLYLSVNTKLSNRITRKHLVPFVMLVLSFNCKWIEWLMCTTKDRF